MPTPAKAAVIGLSEALRSELAEAGIGVSAFCPGPVQTNIREGGRTVGAGVVAKITK